MKKNTLKKIKKFFAKHIMPFVIGGVIGFGFAIFVESQISENQSFLLWFIIGFISAGISLVLHIFLHEIGHLIAGKMSGYDVVSIRFFSLTFVKKDGKWSRKKFNIVGAPGQCLMSPPEPVDGKFPFIFYNLGGVLMNFIFGGLAVALYFILPDVSNLWWIFMPFGAVGIFVGILNIVPISSMTNDGFNLVTLVKNDVARRVVWLMLHINAEISKGLRPREIISEKDLAFLDNDDPNDKNFNNVLVSAGKLLRLGLLVDNHDFENAKTFAQRWLNSNDEMPEIYRKELSCELLFFELIGECRKEEIENLYTKDLQQYIKATSFYMSRQRLLYAYAKLFLKDEAEAEKALQAFNKTRDFTPSAGEIPGEQEMMELVDNLAKPLS